jgi:hypothetical protein
MLKREFVPPAQFEVAFLSTAIQGETGAKKDYQSSRRESILALQPLIMRKYSDLSFLCYSTVRRR